MSKMLSLGNWQLGVGEERVLHQQQVAKLTQLVEKWSATETAIRKEDAVPVWAVRHLNVPTILCRVDLVPFEPDCSPEAGLFEVEARPAGFGILLQLFPEFEHIRSFWEPLAPVGAVVLGSRETAAEDTRVFSEIMGWKWLSPHQCANGHSKRLWARGSALDEMSVSLDELESRALAPVTSHGDKTYLLHMGLASQVNSPEELPWESPFVIKPQKGSKSDSVLLWHPQEKKKKTRGLYSRTKISNALRQDRQFIRQSFMTPQEQECHGKRGFTIWRIYFGYDVCTSQWRFAGGLWNWRPCLKVHGASDSMVGGLLEQPR